MKDVRCLVGLHRWQKKQVEDSQFFQCSRCGKDHPGSHMSANPGMGAAGGAG